MIDVILWGEDVDAVTSPSARCLIGSCGLPFEDDESVFRIRNHKTIERSYMHRRCIELLFRNAPVDGESGDKEFKRYRRRLLKRYAS